MTGIFVVAVWGRF